MKKKKNNIKDKNVTGKTPGSENLYPRPKYLLNFQREKSHISYYIEIEATKKFVHQQIYLEMTTLNNLLIL